MSTQRKATSALQAAIEFGGFDLTAAAGMTANDVREYFEAQNFRRMFGADADDVPALCGGWPFETCAEAVIVELGLR